MRLAERIGSRRPPMPERPASPAALRDRVSLALALATIICLAVVFVTGKSTKFLMPGPLTSSHATIGDCGTCHTKSGSGKLSWLHGLVAGDPLADSKACLTCHKMPETAFNAHGSTIDELKHYTERLTKIADTSPPPTSARAQSLAFPTHDIMARGMYCATCHQEHQGADFDLNRITNEQCRSCHVVKFDSFARDHPKFENYPFKSRTRLIYDHASHFGKHYPEVAKKDPSKRIPANCSTCHDSRDDKRIMAVQPFDKTCSGCHLDQIRGKERVSGPKGIAFLSLPGLDLPSLKKKNAGIGEWPDASEAALTPFMKVMLGRTAQGRVLLKTVDRLNLQDLTNASDAEIKAVTDLAWEIKRLLHALIKEKAAVALAHLDSGDQSKLNAGRISDLTASIPRDVVIRAQQQWLPNLAAEMTRGPGASDRQQETWSAVVTEPEATAPQVTAAETSPEPADPQEPAASESPSSSSSGSGDAIAKTDPQTCLMRVFGECLLFKEREQKSVAREREAAVEKAPTAPLAPDTAKLPPPSRLLPGAMRAGLKEVAKPDAPDASERKPGASTPNPKTSSETQSPAGRPKANAAGHADELLYPTEEELRAISALNKAAGKAFQQGRPPADRATEPAGTPPAPAAGTSRAGGIESDVDPESWAEHGGWYQQDYAIFYRPVGHKDKFITSWLVLTGPLAPKGDTGAAAAVFDYLTGKDAQGSCAKCHSVDDVAGKGRRINFSPPSAETKKGRFTKFVHEPHFSIRDDKGCLTCHALEKGRAYLKSFEQGNAHDFVSNFGEVKKEVCQSCHKSGKARQDCLLCHDYHVNGVVTPTIATRLPTE